MNSLLVDVPPHLMPKAGEHNLAGMSDFYELSTLSFDTETTGLMPYHGDKIFAMSFSDGEHNYYYKVPDDGNLSPHLIKLFQNPTITWYLFNAKFDMHFLWTTFKVRIAGTVIDAMTLARLEYNDHLSYSLDACAKRIGLSKSNAVEEYIKEHDLWEWQTIPGKKVRRKNKFFAKVPHEIMMEYACQDAGVTFKVAEHLKRRIHEIDSLLPDAPRLWSVAEQEFKVTKIVQDMESFGLKIDTEYAEMAFNFYQEESQNAEKEFAALTGQDYKSSPKMFAEVFASEKDKWAYTEKGNPSFDSDAIKRFDHPAAKQVLTIRDAKSRADFFASFGFFADQENFVHPTFNQAGTATGRFSSSEPNFQNLTNDEEAEEGTLSVRNSIIPVDKDWCIVSFDYDQQEYRMMLDYAGEEELIEQVKAGVDVHQATADMMGVSRKYAKTLNFMLLYGGGVKKLAEALALPEHEAKNLRDLYFSKLPKVQKFIATVIKTARQRGYVYNWMGRRYYCSSEFAYKMPNRIIQGGGADVLKTALIGINELLRGTRSTLFLTVHDELDFYIHKNEFILIPKIKETMERAYVHKNLPLTVSVSHSWKSLGELVEGPPASLEAVWSSGAGGAGGLGEHDILLKCFGVHPKASRTYSKFRVTGNSLYGESNSTGPDTWVALARVDHGVLKFNAKQLGVDLSIFAG